MRRGIVEHGAVHCKVIGERDDKTTMDDLDVVIFMREWDASPLVSQYGRPLVLEAAKSRMA